MAQGDTTTAIDKMFSKGTVQDLGKNKTPDYFADDLRNIRIENRGITVCNGFANIHKPETAGKVKGIIYNGNNDKLFFCHDSKFQEFDLSAGTASNIGSIGTNNRCRFIVYGDYTIILTGADEPYYYDGSTLTQAGASQIAASVNPEFGASFAGFTVINNQADPNVFLVSNPITLANQANCVDWEGGDAESISTRGKIQGFGGALNRLWIFTDQTIEYIDRNNVTTTGGIASLFTVITTSGEELVNPDSVVVAGDAVYFMTKDKKIKVLGYQGSLEEPQLTNLSDIENQSIDRFMQTYLAEDQSDAFGFYDRTRGLVKFFVKSIFGTENDICIIWDIENSTWLIDDSRPYSCMTRKNDEYYAGSVYNLTLYEDETGSDFDGDDIERYFLSTLITFGAAALVKQYRGATVSGQITSNTVIDWDFFVDGKSVLQETIDGSDYFVGTVGNGIGSQSIGGESIGGGEKTDGQSAFIDFSKVVTHGNLRSTGKSLQLRRSGKGKAQEFILDDLTLTYRPRKRYRLKDK